MQPRRPLLLIALIPLLLLAKNLHAAESVYSDALGSNWQNWSWQTTLNLAQSTPTQSGIRSIQAQFDSAWAGVYLRRAQVLDAGGLGELRFAIHGGSQGNQRVNVVIIDGSDNWLTPKVITATANRWTNITVPLTELDSPDDIFGIAFQDATGTAQPTFYLDTINLTDGTTPPPPPANLTMTIDLNAATHSINPDIYGMSFASENIARDTSLTINRWGGNATTRFNYQVNVSNRASDWYFENIADPDPGTLPTGNSADNFVEQNRRTQTQSLITLPMIGWTPKNRDANCGFAQSKYGAQDDQNPYRTDCGNGFSGGNPVTGNDPTDTSRRINSGFVVDWVAHLTSRFSNATNGGVRFYALDNEPMLWNSTHRDVRPNPLGYDELRDLSIEYASSIKQADPTALITGPAVWGWTAYYYSAVDVQSGNFSNPPDRNAHGGVPLIPWYLSQMADYDRTNGQRLLDYLDLHYYPQAQGVALGTAGGRSTQQLRLRSTRSLWDANYQDESWINEPVRLIPRAKQWIDNNYPGTRLAINEYNFGGLEHINGAVTQAEVLGIFGRERVDMAALWTAPDVGSPGANAFRMYRNYDGSGSQFGDRSLATTSSDPGAVSVFAAKRSSDQTTTVVLVNKTFSAANVTLQLAGAPQNTQLKVYQYSDDNLTAIEQLSPLTLANQRAIAALPGQSITLLELKNNGGGDSSSGGGGSSSGSGGSGSGSGSGSSSGGGQSGLRLLTTVDKPDANNYGWVEFENNTKQWINAACRVQLDAAGVTTKVTSWNEISAIPDTAPQSCAKILELVDGAPRGGPLLTQVVTTPDRIGDGDYGWVFFNNNSKQWINSDCRAQLQNNGETLNALPWSAISERQDLATPLPCADITRN